MKAIYSFLTLMLVVCSTAYSQVATFKTYSGDSIVVVAEQLELAVQAGTRTKLVYKESSTSYIIDTTFAFVLSELGDGLIEFTSSGGTKFALPPSNILRVERKDSAVISLVTRYPYPQRYILNYELSKAVDTLKMAIENPTDIFRGVAVADTVNAAGQVTLTHTAGLATGALVVTPRLLDSIYMFSIDSITATTFYVKAVTGDGTTATEGQVLTVDWIYKLGLFVPLFFLFRRKEEE